eukprot:CAMPEP_0177502924 /NCGR_PEP_ID=MMETSP0369-20130122/38037_1 /TAXON_ID=447022 ORGANISM="Scrippsiella hangoei-like, Strain SHHI-4" /NCGR_SAMPLE_ID=MMETSP0369 /ASSEMBLY_ACC=CAM_ASM_000364 /LENGTH=187 /DNA_ID=CAMNT_0018980569 /DNA_START=69 /DNA_END=629 /DNA_ORIENTATION=-
MLKISLVLGVATVAMGRLGSASEDACSAEGGDCVSMLATRIERHNHAVNSTSKAGSQEVPGSWNFCGTCGDTVKGVSWDGKNKVCDVPDDWTCSGGHQSACDAGGNFWTGDKCCVKSPATCVPGLESSCSASGMHWTGTLCCVPKGSQCVAGCAEVCAQNGHLWTGTYCCLEEPMQCVAGMEGSCKG